MITSTIHVLILVPVFFLMMKERANRSAESNRELAGSSVGQRFEMERSDEQPAVHS